MIDHPVLYLGDTSLEGAARYLAGLMSSWKLAYQYIPSDRPVDDAAIVAPRRLYILSDYPARLFDPELQHRLVERVAQGAGLLMIGGWESFCGHGGDWAGTPIARILPVHVSMHDDRVNCDQPALVTKKTDHPITNGLPWNDRPPTIGGFNRFEPKARAPVLLEVHRFAARCLDAPTGAMIHFEQTERHPLLVVGYHQGGQTAALATDIAPHWVGGLVDWGTGRVTGHAPGSYEIEVGDLYAAFLRQLVHWTGNLG